MNTNTAVETVLMIIAWPYRKLARAILYVTGASPTQLGYRLTWLFPLHEVCLGALGVVERDWFMVVLAAIGVPITFFLVVGTVKSDAERAERTSDLLTSPSPRMAFMLLIFGVVRWYDPFRVVINPNPNSIIRMLGYIGVIGLYMIAEPKPKSTARQDISKLVDNLVPAPALAPTA